MTVTTDTLQNEIRSASMIIRDSSQVVVLTGAGISTGSGIPDFRSPNTGLWERIDPLEVASLLAFRHDPVRFYRWLRELAVLILNARPNCAHESLTQLQQLGFAHTIITQNVDTLHQRSGAQNVLEIHGSIEHMSCTSCFMTYDSTDYIHAYLADHVIPRCPYCKGVLKPDLVLIGEQLPVRVWQKAVRACNDCDLIIVLGSSLEILPVARLPLMALEKGARFILINRMPTYLDERADILLHEDLTQVLPLIVEELIRDVSQVDLTA
jgi:NAD-dependent deacetylase